MASPPPLPAPPPSAAELARYSFSPPDFMSINRSYNADSVAQNLVFDAWETRSPSQKYRLFIEALRKFPFSVDAYNGLGDLFRREYKEIERAVTCYQYAEQCGNLIWPELKEKEEIPWGMVETRPYLRTYHGLALSLLEKGDIDTAVEKLKFLLRVNPNDNQGCRVILFQALIDKGDYKEAEEIAVKHSNGRKSIQCYFRYGFVLIDFVAKSDQLEETLVQALQNNNLVPQLLLEQQPLPPQPDTVSPHTIDEASDYVHAAMDSWRRVPGVLDWLRDMQTKDGPKPSDDGSVLFELLQKGQIMVTVNSAGQQQRMETMEVTSRVENMSGRGLSDFHMPPGMKDHDPAKIVVYATGNEKGGLEHSKFTSFSYERVEKVHFWSVLHSSQTLVEPEEEKEHTCSNCYEKATLKCSRCQITWYCSADCQRNDWKKGRPTPHKVMCPKFIKT